MKKLTIDEISKFVHENSDCILVSTEYEKNSKPLEFICSCGEHFFCKLAKI